MIAFATQGDDMDWLKGKRVKIPRGPAAVREESMQLSTGQPGRVHRR